MFLVNSSSKTCITENGSEEFDKFLEILGEKVQLNGFAGFAAGLDTKFGQTGNMTVNTKWKEYEITFHVSTLLPFFPGDEQQIQRKRHIGNGIITIREN